MAVKHATQTATPDNPAHEMSASEWNEAHTIENDTIQTAHIADGAVTDAKVATGIDAAKLGDGSVSNAEFQYLNGVTSAIQTQIDGKADTTHTHATITQSVSQTAHGFSVGDLVYETSTANTYAKAQADAAATADVIGIVTTVTDANTFTLTLSGVITAGVPTATAGTVYYLSPTTAGALTATEPTTVDHVSKPVLVVLQSATRALFVNWRGIVVTAVATGDVTGPASSVDSELALFSGTGGKTIKRASTTGVLKATSGVIAAASAGTDYVAPGATTSSGLTMTTARILGRTTASTGAIEEITIGSGLSLSGGSLSATGGSAETVDPARCQGRLTLTTGTAVTTSDVTAASTLYFTPFGGNLVALYNGSAWAYHTLTERSLALSGLTSGANYDVFLYDNAGTLTLELVAWTNDTTRATALAVQDGVYVKTGATTRRYVGTIRTTGTTTTEDSVTKRYVWNYYNRTSRPMRAVDTTDSWSYATATIRQANGATANKVEYVCGVAEDPVEATTISTVEMRGLTTAASAGVGVDSTTAFSGQWGAAYNNTAQSQFGTLIGRYRGVPGIGYHYVAWLEIGGTGGSLSLFYGDDGGFQQNGLQAEVRG